MPVQCWAASTGLPGASRPEVTWRRSAPQYSCRLMVLAQLPGGLSPARPAGRGAPARRPGRCHTAGHRGRCRRRSSPAARPAATGRPARPGMTGSTGTRAAAPAPAAGSGPGPRRQGARRAARPGARGGAAPGPGCRPPGRPGWPGMCQPSAVTSVPTVTWWRRASASSQLSRASPGTIGTRSGSVRAGTLTRRRPAACRAGPGRPTAARRRTRRPAGGAPARRPHRSAPGPAARRSVLLPRTGSPSRSRG